MNRVFVTGVGSRRAPKAWMVLSEGSTLLTGARDFRDSFGSEPTTLEADLLRLAAAVFAADRACARGEREDIGRQIELSVPVTNIAVLLPLVRDIERVLRFLSNDGWTIELRQQRGPAERSRRWPAGHDRSPDDITIAVQLLDGTRLEETSFDAGERDQAFVPAVALAKRVRRALSRSAR